MSTSIAPAGSRRFWIVVACFAVANISVWLVHDRIAHRHLRGELHVEAVEPQDLSSAGPRPTIRWHFNNDVVPSSDYGREPGTVTPAVAGHWSWDNPRTLCFTPDADLPRAQRVSITLSDSFLRSRGGGSLDGPCVTSFDSARLTVQSVQQIASKPMDRFVFEMQFSDAVSPADVLAHLKAWTYAGQPVKCEALGLASGRTVRILTDSIPKGDDAKTANISLILSAGLTGQSGPLGLASDYNGTVQLQRALAAMELQAESPLRDSPHLSLRFNNDVDAQKLNEVLSIDPAIAFSVENQGNGMVNLTGDFKAGQRYLVTIAPPPAGADSDAYPVAAHLSTYVPDRDSGVWMDTTQGYLSSAGNRTILAHAVNVDAVRVRVTRVYDSNIVSWRNQSQSSQDEWNGMDAFSTPIAERKIKIIAAKNSVKDLHLSLDDLLPAGTSDGVFRVTLTQMDDASAKSVDDNSDESDQAPSAVVTLSDIGLTAKRTRDGVVVWATSLRDARPLEGVRVRVFSSKNQPLGEAVTDHDGLATVSHVNPAKDETAAVILADVVPVENPIGPYIAAKLPTTQPARALTWLDLRNTAWDLGDSDTNGRGYLHRGYEAYMYTDRGVYRPGETVHLRAIVRAPDNAVPENAFPVRWLIRRPDLHDWRDQTVTLDADGAAKFDVTIPPEMPTGEWTAQIGLPGEAGSSARDFGTVKFQVEEFIPNRMKASLAFKGHENGKTAARFSTSEGNLIAEVQSDYLFGRPAAGLSAELTTLLRPVPFSAGEWGDWTFGDSGQAGTATEATTKKKKPRRQTEEQTLDSAGHLEWAIDVGSALGLGDKPAEDEQGPWELTASAGVREAGGRAVTIAKHILVDALPAYIGARRDANSPAMPGAACALDLAMVRPDGSILESNDVLRAALSRETWNTSLVFTRGHFHYESTRVLEPVTKNTVKLANGKGTWSPVAPSSGSYVAVFRNDKSGAMTSLEFDVTDGSPWDDNVSRDRPERLTLRVLPPGTGPTSQPSPLDKGAGLQQFSVGDKVNVLVASPFAGRLLLTVETDDVVQRHVIEMTGTHVVVPVQLSQACWPNAFISASVIRAIDPNAKWQTHRAYGVTRVRIDPSDRRLNIALSAPTEIRPEQSLEVGILVTDATGAPAANTPVTLAAVDEGICALTNFATPDPLAFFSADRALGVDSADMYDLLAPEVAKADDASGVGGDAAGEPAGAASRHITPIVARRVKPVSLAWLEVRTDAQGLARASFPLPEFQGQLRLMAVAYNPTGLGSSDKPVTVHSPVMAQSSWPRFAAPGDRFTVPLVLFNNTASSGQANVSVELQTDPNRPAGLLGFGEHAQSKLQLPSQFLPAHGQSQIQLPVTVGSAAGVAHVRLQVEMNGDNFEESMELPVRPAAPMMQYGGYAIASTTQPAVVTAPTAILPGTGSLAIRVSAWPSLHFSEGLDYLDRYPYGCVEQTTSTCFPLLALGDIGKQIDPRRFDPDQIKSKISGGILDLIGMQTSDGGLAMWPGGTETWPWGTVYAAHFIVEARRAGYDVPDDFYNHLLKYVRQDLNAGTDDPEQLETQAYAAYVLALAGNAPRPIMDRLAELATEKSLPDEDQDHAAIRSDARLFLACARAMSGRTDLATQLIPDALPLPRLHRQNDGNVGSPIRDLALLIYTLANVQPTNPALPDLVQRLVDDGAHNQWDSTQDTAFAMLALSQYLHHLPHPKPFDSAQLLSGTNVLAQERGEPALAMNFTDPAAGTPYAVHITGTPDSSAYVSWLETGVPLSAPPDAQHGIAIHRRYLSLDGTELHSASSGELLKVEITIDAPANERNLVIEDLLPAGLEAENARLATAAKSDDQENDSGDKSGVARFAGDRIDVRDDRVVVMGAMPDAGKARCEYLARAVTPGVYVVPPVRAEAMYDIASCGISGAGGTFTVSQDHGSMASIHE